VGRSESESLRLNCRVILLKFILSRLLDLRQIHDDNTSLAEAQHLILEEKKRARAQTDGSAVIHDAGKLCKQAVPSIPMIFDEEKMSSYFAARGW